MSIETIQDKQSAKSELIEAAVTYSEGGHWHKVELTESEYLELLKKGVLENRPVIAISLWYTINTSLVYDFIQAKQGNSPWSMENV